MPANTRFSAAPIPYTNLKFYMVNEVFTLNSIFVAIRLSEFYLEQFFIEIL